MVEKPRNPQIANLRAAAERLRVAAFELSQAIEAAGDTSLQPKSTLPVDDFLAEMELRKNAPRLIFEPTRLGNVLWTESLTLFTYAEIEQAFTSASLLPGCNVPGYLVELHECLAWVEEKIADQATPVPEHFATRTAQLFLGVVLEDRRKERVPVLQRIERDGAGLNSDLFELRDWLKADIEDERLRKLGRPYDTPKIVFATHIARLWTKLTGRKITRGSATNFVQFVEKCWESGGVAGQRSVRFKRIVRDHL